MDNESIPGIDHRQLQDEAVAWLVRRDSDDWSTDDQLELNSWLTTSAAHRVAFLRLETGWEEARRLKALGAGRPHGVVPPIGVWRQSPFFESPRGVTSSAVTETTNDSEPGEGDRSLEDRAARRHSGYRYWLAAAVASLVAGLILGVYFRFGEVGDRYSTPIGGISSVFLRDGSKITLNTHSQVRVLISSTERRIDLDRGEAFFEVAKDSQRPFVVRAGDKRVIAVGTRFSVRRGSDEVQVIVTDGTVRLETGGGRQLQLGESRAATIPAATAPAAISLKAGSIARARDDDLLVRAEPLRAAEEILSWRRGYLAFHDTALSEAVAEFNRYNINQIKIGDPDVASIRISGMFRPTNSEAFLRLVQDGYSLQVSTAGETTILTKP